MLQKILLYPITLILKIENKLLRFLLVGLLNTAFGYFLFLFFIWIGLHYSLSLLFSQIIGVLFNYKTTGYIVFENKSNKLLFSFFLVYGFVYLINVLELYFLGKSELYEYILSRESLQFIHSLPINQDKLSDAIGQAIVILPNSLLVFYLNKKFVFEKKKNQG
ncbi:MAG: GtrA family protein [Bacteroidales bacterium]|nr:GtrA family protein [Bacteroidales bacterium]MDD4703667.1 GtrA family protein [Bacteroidales bacterium]